LTSYPGTFNSADFSPSGEWVAVNRVWEGQRDIWTLPLGGGPPLQFTNDPAADVTPSFSPDGTHLIFASDRSGRFQIWWAPIEDGRRVGVPQQLTFEDTNDSVPTISPDGLILAWLGDNDDGGTIWVQPVENPGVARPLTEGLEIECIEWEPGGRSLLASGNWEGPNRLGLRRVFVTDGSVERVTFDVNFGSGDSGGAFIAAGTFSSSGDGRFLVHDHSEMRGEVWILEAEDRHDIED
jgi:TolB protein